MKNRKYLFTNGTMVKRNGKWMTQLADPATFNQKHEPISKEAREMLDKESEKNLQLLRKKFPHLNKGSKQQNEPKK